MNIYFAGGDATRREQLLIDARIRHRLLTYAYLGEVILGLLRWGVVRDK